MYNIEFKDQSSEGLGIVPLSLGRRQRAAEKLETYSVPNSNQDMIEHTGFYEPYEREILFYAPEREIHALINAWLTGYGKLRTSIDPGGYFKAHVVDELKYERYLVNNEAVGVTFKINPGFFYMDSGDEAITLTAPGMIYNPGTHKSEPLIRIVGNGNITLTINGRTLTFTGIETFIDIDPEITPMYFKNNENVGEKVVGEDPYFDVGENVISWTGAVTEINILGRWREL